VELLVLLSRHYEPSEFYAGREEDGMSVPLNHLRAIGAMAEELHLRPPPILDEGDAQLHRP
jgi:hypothetical protein